MSMQSRPAVLTLLTLVSLATAATAADWPAWRGPKQDGTTTETGLPDQWSNTQNVAWKVALPGPGNSTPIVYGNNVYVTCALEKGRVRSVLCFDRGSGKQLWRGDTPFAAEETTHETNPYCAASPATDGRIIVASHGSAGVVAYDVGGKQLWRRDLGPMHHIWGNASSPVLIGEQVIQLCGPGPEARLVALDAKTGKTLWENPLDEAKGKPDQFKGGWGTPVLHGGQIVLAVPGYVAGLDPKDGKELWRCRGLGDLVYTSPVIGNGVIVAMSGYGGPALAMRVPGPGDRGDLTDSHRLWREEKPPQRIGSGVIAGDYFYLVNEPGIAQCWELKTGKVAWRGRLTGSTWSSSVLSGDRIYVTDQTGETFVFRASPAKLEVLQHNELGDETTRASVAPSGGQLFIRTHQNLYCIGGRKGA
jgi:outer membrane protein assembly factor BamB